MKTLNTSLLVSLLFLLSSCGWQLRGNQESASQINISLSAEDEYGALYREFERELKRQGLDNPDQGETITLKVLGEKMNQEELSLNVWLDSAESELTYELHYLNPIDAPPKILTVHGRYMHEKQTISAKNNERDKLRKELRSRAIKQLINQLKIQHR